MPLIVLIILLALATALQFIAGDFPVAYFAFPLNVVLLALTMSVVMLLWKYRRKSGFVRFMLSSAATNIAFGLFLLMVFVIGVTGFRWIIGTWPSVVIILYFQIVLMFVIMRGWREKTATGARLGAIRWRFLFLHTGLLITVMSAFWGQPDLSESRVKAFRNVPVSEVLMEDGSASWITYQMELNSFDVRYGHDGVPSDYSAGLSIDDKNVLLKVNHPYSRTFAEDIYLTGYDVSRGPDSDYVILQIVKDPWRYGKTSGIILMIVGVFLLFAGGPRRRYGNEID